MKPTALTKALITAGVISMSTTALAAAYTPPEEPSCLSDGVSVPCEKSAWDFGLNLLYVKQFSEENWHTIDRTNYLGSVGLGPAHIETFEHEPNAAWGFRAEASYHFGTGSDIHLNWTRFKKTSHSELEDVNYVLDSPYIPGWESTQGGIVVTNTPWSRIQDSTKTTFDMVNLEFGQIADFGENFDIRFHSGLSYVNLNHELHVRGSNGTNNGRVDPGVRPELYSATHAQKSRFRGIGPRFGQDSTYNFDSGFSVYARYALSALVGTTKLDSTITQYEANQANNGSQLLRVDVTRSSQNSIVLGLDTRVGMQYAQPLGSGDLIFDVALHVVIYQGIVQQIDADFDIGSFNWGYVGPSIGFKWLGAL